MNGIPVKVLYKGKEMQLSHVAKLNNINGGVLYQRVIKSKWPLEVALAKETHKHVRTIIPNIQEGVEKHRETIFIEEMGDTLL